jgi:REP element-mobilizing transposase RayT
MPNYRRAFVPNGCWFFTHNLLERREALLVDHVEALRCAFAETQKKYPFDIAAIVVLPDHLHAVWTLPPDDADFSTRWRLIKMRFAKSLPQRERRSAVRKSARRARYLAAPILGAFDPRRRRLRASCRISLHQSDQARPGAPRSGLAALVVSPRRRSGPIPARLGRRD